MSFAHAKVSKGLMIGLGLGSLAASLLDVKYLLNLQLVPHLSRDHQVPSPFLCAIQVCDATLHSTGGCLRTISCVRTRASFLYPNCFSTMLESIWNASLGVLNLLSVALVFTVP